MSEPGAAVERVALVSGAARPPGIGRATALRLAASGCTVICADLVSDQPTDTAEVTRSSFDAVMAEVEHAARRGGGRVHVVAQDGDDPRWNELIEGAIARYGRLDICCALNGVTGAHSGDGRLAEVDEASFRRGLELNLTVAWLLTSAAARAMIAGGRPGAMAVLSSHAALLPKAGVGVVGAARAAVDHLVAVLAKELGPHAIRVNAVAPLAVAPTEQFPNPGLVALAERVGVPLSEWLGRNIPLGRAQSADETAAVIEFLCSDAASFVSGVTVPVHGGAQP
jgi:NAD(P)-dependent dehydrogenase (short-subunit alcohol dehydrogenase family)